jgi:hypothetical protein
VLRRGLRGRYTARMADEDPGSGVSRRQFLRGFLRGEPAAEAAAPAATVPSPPPVARPRPIDSPIVAAYLIVLRVRAVVLPWGVAATELPASVDDLKAAIIACVRPGTPPVTRDDLRHAYASVSWFTTPEDVERLRAGKRVLDAQDWSPEGRAAYVSAHARRQEILQEVARLGREFDAVVPEYVRPAPPPAEGADDAARVAATGEPAAAGEDPAVGEAPAGGESPPRGGPPDV